MRFMTATGIFDGIKFLAPDSVLVIGNGGALTEIVRKAQVSSEKVEVLDGIICPGFINIHCHTELSHMKGLIPRGTGLPDFGKSVIMYRDKTRKEEIAEHILEADRQMHENGITFCGDISNTDISFAVKERAKVKYHTFIELIGLNPAKCAEIMKTGKDLLAKLRSFGLKGSLAPHAPYSTSKELIGRIARQNIDERLPSSIHFLESEEERDFFKGRQSGFDRLYSFLGMDISAFRPSGDCLYHIHEAIASQRTLLVHNTVAKVEDADGMKDRDVFHCFCPRANLYIEEILPDISFYHNERICIGTDSLASNDDLSIVEEAHVLMTKKGLHLENALRAMTGNPANFLGIQNEYGRLLERKNTGLNLVKYNETKFEFVKKII